MTPGGYNPAPRLASFTPALTEALRITDGSLLPALLWTRIRGQQCTRGYDVLSRQAGRYWRR
jgi:hypothetical protein